MDYYVTNRRLRYDHRTVDVRRDLSREMQLVKVYPGIKRQAITGFGGALTEASAYVFSRMSAKNKEKLLELYFGSSGNRYTLGRLHIQSCDFSLGNRAYVEEGDRDLKTFSIAGDTAYQIPLVKAVLKVNPDMQFLASPWSPPAFMKNNHEMNHGGRLLTEYYSAWAEMMVQYLLAYRREGITVERITVQNEPAAVQTWESCIYSGEQEGIFAANYLRKALDKAGLEQIKIFIWDHNKDIIIERCAQTFAVPGADAAVDGIAFHWYTGDHFPALEYVRRQYPDKELLFTEGCVEYLNSPERDEVSKAESYAHSMIGDFNAGMNGFMDWNIILDEQGGPNHVKNFCEAPIMYDTASDMLNVRLSYCYTGHFSRYVKPGARLLLSTSYTKDLECAAFENPDGEQFVVILNETGKNQRFALRVSVKNVGDCPGKEVVQIYGEAPQGVLGKPVRQLAAFRKTRLLQPGETEVFTISIPKYRLASFDDGGLTGYQDCYVLEEGDYRFYAGADIRSAALAGSYFQKFIVVERLRTACAPQEPFQRMKPEKALPGGEYSLCYEAVPLGVPAPDGLDKQPPEIPYAGDQGYQLADVLKGKVSLEQFQAQLSDEDLICMFRGEGMCSPLVTPGTAAAFGGVTERLRGFGIPAVCCADGPSGIRMDCGIQAFSLPNGTALGCTFNEDLVRELFEQVGGELRANRIDTLLGPGMNIHRHPLNGRNFEYLSEDPLLTGKIVSAQLQGMHTCGVTGTIKHFAGNNQEYGRRSVDSVISQRALREIYLKGFEIAVKEGHAISVMTTYGAVNGVWTAGSRDLCTRILRDEWGFDGIVMSDWWAEANYPGCAPARTVKAPMAAAQNDLYMCVQNSLKNSEGDDMPEQLAAGYITRGELQRNAGNILRFILKTPALSRFVDRAADDAERPFTLPATKHADTPVKVYSAETGGNTVKVDGHELHPKRGRMDEFELVTAHPAAYSVTITAKSDLGILAQLPVSIYCDNELRTTVLLQGSEGAVTERTVDIGRLEGARHRVSLFYGASGLEIQSLTIHWE